jgi:hypothetical protein
MSELLTFTAAQKDLFDDLGEDVTYNGTTIKGIFIENYLDINTGAGIAESSRPTLEVIKTDVPGIAHNATIVIGGNTYRVTGIRDMRRYTQTLDLVKV